jgi:hypothetical protein
MAEVELELTDKSEIQVGTPLRTCAAALALLAGQKHKFETHEIIEPHN